ncbi:MAG: RNA polymerase sigma factor [Pseudomonadota bacterium]
MPAAPTSSSLNAFLAGVERRALRRAQLATRDRDDALDLVQDAMLRLARSYGGRPASQWPALFHRILVNRIRDWQRSQKLRRRLFFWVGSASSEYAGDGADPIENIADPQGSDGAGDLQGAQLASQLEQALLRLPARQRETFELRVWEGLSVEDTAAAMGCSAGSVKTHLSRALEALRITTGEELR